jgi:sulfatase maturation enzyme AslB (radical SAM superfamily)
MNPKDVLTNKHFCPMPWTGLMYNFDGKVKNCIRSDGKTGLLGDIKNLPIEEILLGPINVTKQTNIIANAPAAGCHTCYDLEHGKEGFDIISDRIFYIREFKKTPLDTYRPNNFDLQTIDVRWTNLCNFACVYCSPEFSSKWANELNANISTPLDEQQEKFKEYIFKHAKQLKHVYLAGGEPLLMKENLELLQQLNPDVNLRINTNLSKVDTGVFDAVCQFKNVHWTVSVETIESEFEYIRFGGCWQDFLDNLNTIRQLDHKISFNMLWFLLNYDSVFGCVDYIKGLGFHNNSFVIGALLTPDYLNIRHLPENVLNLLKLKLQSEINKNPGYLLEDSYKNMLHYIEQPIEKNLTNSFEQLATMDQRRGVDSSKIFTELYKLKEGK